MFSRRRDGEHGADLSEISARRLFLSLIWIAEVACFSIFMILRSKGPQLLSATPLSDIYVLISMLPGLFAYGATDPMTAS